MSQRKRKATGVGAATSRALSENELALAGALEWLLADVKKDALVRRLECRWTTSVLIAVAILWVWLDEPTLAGRYGRSLKIARRLFRVVPKITYQAFIKQLGRHTTAALDLIKPLLRSRLQRSLDSQGSGTNGTVVCVTSD